MRTFVAGAVALVVLVGLAGWNVILRNDRNQAQTTADRYRSAVASLTTAGAHTARIQSTDGTSLATVVDTNGVLKLVTVALPRNARTSTYVVWGLKTPTDKAPVALGTFDVAHAGVDLPKMNAVATGLDYPLYAMSKEPGRTVPKAPTDVLGSGARA